MELDTLGIVEQNEKYKYTDNELFIKKNNVFIALLPIIRLEGRMYSLGDLDEKFYCNYQDVREHINLGDDVIVFEEDANTTIGKINAVIIVKTLKGKLYDAIKNENYELAQEIQNEINNNNNTTLRLLETINFL